MVVMTTMMIMDILINNILKFCKKLGSITQVIINNRNRLSIFFHNIISNCFEDYTSNFFPQRLLKIIRISIMFIFNSQGQFQFEVEDIIQISLTTLNHMCFERTKKSTTDTK